MYGYNAMEVQEAFVKIREQVSGPGPGLRPWAECALQTTTTATPATIRTPPTRATNPQAKAYLAMRDELNAGLNMLNTTNLNYFNAHHQAEIFRLKGVFLQVRYSLFCWYDYENILLFQRVFLH